VVRYPYLRHTGAGTLFRAGAGVFALTSVVALALMMVTSLLGAYSPLQGVLRAGLLAIVSLGVAVTWSWWASRRLDGGLTGDTYGAANELVELAVLVLAPPLALLVGRMV